MLTRELFEMAKPAGKCDKCGKGPINKTHYWYKGAWKCKGGGKPAEEKKADVKPADDKTASAAKRRSDAATDKPKDEKKPLKTAAELFGSNGRPEPKMSQSMRDANEKAANERQAKFIAQLKKERGIKDDDE